MRITSAHGYWLIDADRNRYVDLVCSWGPMILGHAHPAVVGAVQRAASTGLSFGAPTPAETELAAEIRRRVPPAERVRLVNSGTEATMSAVRLARGFTGRPKIVKFAGCYHGHVDALLAAGGSGVANQGISGSAGVPDAAVADTIVAPYNVVPALDVPHVGALGAGHEVRRAADAAKRPHRRIDPARRDRARPVVETLVGQCRRHPSTSASSRAR